MTNIRLILIASCLLINVSLRAMNKDSVNIMKAATDFVTAFNNFDWPNFRKAFTDDATIFYPFWGQARRVGGRRDIESVWIKIFPEFKDSNNKSRLQINPKEIRIQIYGNTAIVTFHLGDGAINLSRRTLVMIKEKRNWKIAHLHASTVSKEKD